MQISTLVEVGVEPGKKASKSTRQPSVTGSVTLAKFLNSKRDA